MELQNPSLYIFDKTPFQNIGVHSVIREYFDYDFSEHQESPSLSSFEDESFFIVQTSHKPKTTRGLLDTYPVDLSDYSEGDIVEVRCRFSLSNRHRKKKETEKYSVKEHSLESAFQDFKEKSGLIEIYGDETKYFEKPTIQRYPFIIEKKMNIDNIFLIDGKMKIHDIDIFKKAVAFGVGSRRTYGLGLLFAELHKKGSSKDYSFIKESR